MSYKVIDLNNYYRKDVFNHFASGAKCSISMTARLDVTDLVKYSKATNTKFYINTLYIIAKALNSRDDYKMEYRWQTNELVCYDTINPTAYIFYPETETCSPLYLNYNEDYSSFYNSATTDIEEAKRNNTYRADTNHPNWFDASYMPWVSYDSFNVELPDGYLYFMPIISWGKYREEAGRLMMPLTVRMNHAIADSFIVSRVFKLIEEEIIKLTEESNG